MTRPYMKGLPLETRFWLQVDKTPGHGPQGECWHWTGCCSPYGKIFVGGKRVLAHRFSYELHFGEIPNGNGYHGTCVCHRCDNPKCVNPDHLFLGTHKANVDDRNEKGRQSKGPAHQALRQGQRHPQAKLTNEQVLAIRADRRLYREIATDFAIAESTVCNLKRGYRWPHLTTEN